MCIHDYISSTTVYSFIHIFPLSLYSTTKVALTMTQEETTNQSQASSAAAPSVISSRPTTNGDPNYATPRLSRMRDCLLKAQTNAKMSDCFTRGQIEQHRIEVMSWEAAISREKHPKYPGCIAEYKREHPSRSSRAAVDHSENPEHSCQQAHSGQGDNEDWDERYF